MGSFLLTFILLGMTAWGTLAIYYSNFPSVSLRNPPGHLFVGHLFDLDANHPIESMMDLAREYGPIFQIDMPGGNSRVVVSGRDLVDELCDESRFDKMLGPGLRALGADPLIRGLFTSETADPI